MQFQCFVASDNLATTPEPLLQLYSVTKPDREPVKILIIGSQSAVNTVVYQLHHHRFAEPFEWTKFLSVDQSIQIQPGEAVKALIKYLPSS
ncbi:hypothetical protein [Leptothoe kymatousa]|uniref:Uncharacterized protein n=1 Tax=Leptothoe kymatousa TAU-MAC 1615 TaxID=2364775 RepID=A0ABS5Y560_9CYAN|nr:hypothetical protein [Leptothoe kymatousa]MBT9312115.1 hypothetical protein [Leptothoe kymatousa TAU-MAC 1615]